jgi:hypothetical protein
MSPEREVREKRQQNRSFPIGLSKAVLIALLFSCSSTFLIVSLTPISTAASSSYTLSVSSAHGSTYGSGSYSNGTTASFGVSPTTVYFDGTTRYIFTGWSCSGAGCYSGPSSSASVVMNNNIGEYTRWITQYILSISVTGNGTVSPSGQNWYDAGSTVVVSETPEGAGWIFAYWELDGQNVGSSPSLTVVMNSPHYLAANFIKPVMESKLINVTDSYGNNLRNPDGTFYRLDKFEIQYDVVIQGGNPLPPSVWFIVNVTYPLSALSESENRSGYPIFTVLPSATFRPYNVTLTATIFNSVDDSNRPIPSYSYEPFAVVSYSPHFTYFSYMDYNALNSSTYERPFVTLLRYDGNSPGYSYSGDNNTDPFRALNSTGERGIINNFSFTTNGWSISSNISGVNNSLAVITFVPHSNLTLTVTVLNKSTPEIITWSNRVQKYYFLSNISEIKSYVGSSTIYLNVTVNAWYSNSYNSNTYKTSDFNTSYLYEPILYDGYLMFRPYGGFAENFSASIVSHNPSPLDLYLISKAIKIFGNDTQILSSLDQDLYPANFTTVLKPVISNSSGWVFLINQTNLGFPGLNEMPNLTISVSGNSGYTAYTYESNNPPYYLSAPITNYAGGFKTISYTANDSFSLFMMSDFPHSFPLSNFTGYYVVQTSAERELVMQPLSFSFSSPMPYLIRTYGNASAPFFISLEPGNLTQSIQMVYGENAAINVFPNFIGGGIVGLNGNPIPLNGGTSYQISLLIGNESGGISSVYVVNDRGEVLYNQSLIAPFPPQSFGSAGYVGEYTFQIPVGNTNRSVAISLKNAWGGLSVIQGVPIAPHLPPSLNYSPEFLSAILLIALGISVGYSAFDRRKKRAN